MNTSQSSAMKYRWVLIFAAFVIMMIISIYQYSWFLFAYAIQEQLRWNLATISLTFTIFAYAVTFIQPFSGFIADTYGPRKIAVGASFLIGIGLILASYASSPHILYISYGLGGLGVGVLYGISTACAIKWFPDRRGFAVGLVVFGFGAGTALFNWLVEGLLEAKGLRTTFMVLGVSMMTTLIPLSFFYKYPQEGVSFSYDSLKSEGEMSPDFKPVEMLKTYQWFLMYFSFTVTASIVLLFGAQMKMLAREFNVSRNYFSLLLVLFPIGNGLSRILAGAVSDRFGRENTMVAFYSLLGMSILSLVLFGHEPALFASLVVIAALLGGAPLALTPATIGDYYGSRHSTTNYGITYTAKGWSGLISGWLTGYLVVQYGSYRPALFLVGLCCLLAGLVSTPRLLKAPWKKQPSCVSYAKDDSRLL